VSDVVCELIISIDYSARGQRSPAYHGYLGPDFADWIETNTALPHWVLIGRRTYEAMAALPAEVRDEGWQRTTTTPGWLFSRTLEATDWPGLTIVRNDVAGLVHDLKSTNGVMGENCIPGALHLHADKDLKPEDADGLMESLRSQYQHFLRIRRQVAAQ
jgi:hypothetical protein